MTSALVARLRTWRPGDPSGRWTVRPPGVLVGAIAVALAAQRLCLPGTQVPLLLPLAVGAIALGLYLGVLSFDRSRLRLYLVALVAVVVSSLVAELRGLDPALPSVLVLLGIYACGTVVLPSATWRGYRTLLTAFVRVMVGFAVVGAVVFAAQWAGLAYRDWLAVVVPDSMLLQGYYTTNPLTFGSPYFRANGLVFLEPSFFSLFTGLALAAALYLRAGYLTLAVLLLGLITSVSGNGMVVTAVAIVVLAVTRQWRALRPLVLPAVATAVAVFAFSLGPTLLDRATEVVNGDSSASLRFVQPYGIFVEQLWGSAETLLLGRGAGSADDLVLSIRAADLQAPVIPKIFYEYGLVAAILLLGMLWSMFLTRVPTWVLGAGLAVIYWGVNPSLLVPVLPFTLMVFVTLWAPLREPRLPPADAG
jgi:hypothetical protein